MGTIVWTQCRGVFCNKGRWSVNRPGPLGEDVLPQTLTCCLASQATSVSESALDLALGELTDAARQLKQEAGHTHLLSSSFSPWPMTVLGRLLNASAFLQSIFCYHSEC